MHVLDCELNLYTLQYMLYIAVHVRTVPVKQCYSVPLDNKLESRSSASSTSKYDGALGGGDRWEESPSHRTRYICRDLAESDW